MNSECIFCKIANGVIPSHKIYEGEKCLAFLDANPVTRGHTLIVPKEHYENIFDVPEDILSEIAIVSKKIAKLLRENFGAESVNIVNNSGKDAHQIIFHLHFHVIPRYENDGLNLDFDGRVKNLNLEEIAKEIRGE